MINRFDGEYAFLSNFYPVQVTWMAETYPTVEHAYQAAKFLEPWRRSTIRRAITPGRAKRAAAKWCEFIQDGWASINVEVMDQLLHQKFGHMRPLGGLLIATWPHQLIEGNTWGDTFWGVCDGVGANQLGVLLMKIRDELTTL